MKEWTDLFEIFNQFEEDAPTSLGDMEVFEEKCRQKGFEALADELWEWRINQEYHIYREFDDTIEDLYQTA